MLDDGLNLTLNRYPGLHIKRLVPSPCAEGCTGLFAYEDLQRRLERTPPRLEIECHRSGDLVHVPLLSLGLPPSERDEIRGALARLEKQSAHVLDRLEEHASDRERMFLKLQQQVREGLETRCPCVFTVTERRKAEVELFAALVDTPPEHFVTAAGETHGDPDAPIERASSEADFRELEAKLVDLDPTRWWGGYRDAARASDSASA